MTEDRDPDGWAEATDGRKPYERPEAGWLGSLDELTHGGTTGASDGTGHSGSTGSI